MRQKEIAMATFTQTFDIPERETPETCSTSTQTDQKPIGTASLASKSAQTIKKSAKSTSDAGHSGGKDDSHLLATIRGMRIDLAIKEKAMQRLTRELEECKKTVKKLQKEKDGRFDDRKMER